MNNTLGMKTIYRYMLRITDSPVVEMPIGAKVLSVSTQRTPEVTE